MAHLQTLLVDFDGVLHNYTGWTGETDIPGGLIPGAEEALREYVQNYKVVVFSTRAQTRAGADAMDAFLRKELPEDISSKLQITDRKQPAVLCIDDRAFCFHGKFPSVEFIKNFQPHWKRPAEEKVAGVVENAEADASQAKWKVGVSIFVSPESMLSMLDAMSSGFFSKHGVIMPDAELKINMTIPMSIEEAKAFQEELAEGVMQAAKHNDYIAATVLKDSD